MRYEVIRPSGTYRIGYRIFYSNWVLFVETTHKVAIAAFLEYQLQDTIGIEKVAVALHLNVGLIRLVLAGLDLGDEKVLALSKRLFDHLVKSRSENRVDLVELEGLFDYAFIIYQFYLLLNLASVYCAFNHYF